MAASPLPLTNRYVRDLAWACFSPALMHTDKLADDQHNVANCGLSLTAQRRDWLARLDREPRQLLDYLANKPQSRLGLYFERLWHFFLQEDPSVELLAHNLPVREGSKTLGEFDCLYFCRERQRHYHLELAVKYFLAHSATGSDPLSRHWHVWLGPNSRDRLDLKVEHMMQRQIRLSEKTAARTELEKLGITDLAYEVEIKGWLFSNPSQPQAAPRGHNAERPIEHWLRHNELAGHLKSAAYERLAILPRLQWLAPTLLSDVEGLPCLELQQLLDDHFEQSVRPTLIAAFGDSDEELCRFFVAGQKWPTDQGSLSS